MNHDETMPMLLRSTLVLLLIVLAGCAGSREAAHPLAGEWTYSVQTDDGLFEGVLTFTTVDGELQGTITGEGMEESAPLENVTYEPPALRFEFEAPEYGTLRADLEVTGDTYEGDLNVTSYDMAVPMTGVRIE